MSTDFALAQLISNASSLQANCRPITLADLGPLAAGSGRVAGAGSDGSGGGTGAYVHVPFCFHKCHYCDFYSLVDSQDRREPFTRRLLAELEVVGPRARPVETVFVGGGTPTLLAPDQWARLLPALRERLGLSPGGELTVEANPETVTAELASTLAAGGVTRVSIGCQSFEPAHLATLERWHEPESVARSVAHLRSAGLDDLNLDLIFAIPGQTLADWQRDLERALALQPAHVSCYALTYEPGTALTARLGRGQVTPVEEELEAAMYELAIDLLAAAGFEHYEVSAWARPGRRCRHNLLYWTSGDWWALGPSASGHLGGLRWKNAPRLTSYLESGPWPQVVDVELPDPDRAAGEAFMMGLRLRSGMPRERVDRLLRAPSGPRRGAAIEENLAKGLLEWESGALRLTRRGLLLTDTVVAELV